MQYGFHDGMDFGGQAENDYTLILIIRHFNYE